MPRKRPMTVGALPLPAVVMVAELMLKLMQKSLRGEEVDEALYRRIFGNKSGMVAQLERVSNVLASVARIIERQETHTTIEMLEITEEQRVLMEYYARRINADVTEISAVESPPR